MTQWFQNGVAVPFGNANYDTALGGSHNMTFHCAPNTPITSVTNDTKITDISSPTWGKQVTVELTEPVNGHHYFSYQHLSAINPSLKIGDIVHYNDIIGWSGGCTSPGQYDGTHNPTGQNFCDSPAMSSQPQIGIALCDGTGYGYAGWKVFPPIDETLNPWPVIEAYEQAMIPPPSDYNFAEWSALWRCVVSSVDPHSGIAQKVYAAWQEGKNYGFALSPEMDGYDKDGKACISELLSGGVAYWYRPDTFVFRPNES